MVSCMYLREIILRTDWKSDILSRRFHCCLLVFLPSLLSILNILCLLFSHLSPVSPQHCNVKFAVDWVVHKLHILFADRVAETVVWHPQKWWQQSCCSYAGRSPAQECPVCQRCSFESWVPAEVVAVSRRCQKLHQTKCKKTVANVNIWTLVYVQGIWLEVPSYLQNALTVCGQSKCKGVWQQYGEMLLCKQSMIFFLSFTMRAWWEISTSFIVL